MAELLFETSFQTYHVISNLGEGGSGRVYKVENDDRKVFALKCLDASKITTEKRKRFKNEIYFSLRNSHKHIVQVSDYGIVKIRGKQCPFYVMPFYPSTLRELMKKGIPPNRTLHYFSQILDGIEAAHLKSVWHRDLKPENILFDPSLDLLVVADFGIAHFAEDYLQTSVVTDKSTRLANFRYAAPEQRTFGQKVDQKADIYALGLILYEMFTGMLLQGTGHRAIGSLVAEYSYVDSIIEGMIRQLPEERFASIDVIKQKLMAYKNDFVSRQRISQLTNTVVSLSEIADPLVTDPVKLTNVDYQKGQLIFILNHKPNSRWISVFHAIGNFKYIPGLIEPRLLNFQDNKAFIAVKFGEPDQGIVDLFKSYLAEANRSYRLQMETEQLQREDAERKRLRDELEEEQKRQRFRQNLKI